MFERPDTRFHETHSSSSTATITIKNGIYSFKAKALDGVEGGDSGTFVLRDGTIRFTFLC